LSDYNERICVFLKEAIAIQTYWIVDPQQQMITVFQLERSGYQKLDEFRNKDRVLCPSFPSLTMTDCQILNAG
jgi:Uma2 family endonuclease